MKGEKSKADKIKKCLEGNIPVESLGSGKMAKLKRGFRLSGAMPASVEKTRKYIEEIKNIENSEFITAGIPIPHCEITIVKFNKSHFSEDSCELTDSGKKKAEELIRKIISGEYAEIDLPKNTTDRNKKIHTVLNYIDAFARAVDFLSKNQEFLCEDTRGILNSFVSSQRICLMDFSNIDFSDFEL